MQALHTFGTKGKSDASSILVTFMSDEFDPFDVVPLGQHGGRRPGAGRPRKGQARREKTGATLKSAPDRSGYIRRRLLRDAQAGVRDAAILLRGILDGQVTEFAAGVEYGVCRRREPNGRGSENRTKANDWRMFRLFHPKPQKIAPSAASDTRGEEKSMSLRPELSAAAETLK
jgi:hypothetical protein